MHVNIFKNVKASWPQETELDKIVTMMQTSEKIRMNTLSYRQHRMSGNKKDAERVKIKELPAFAPCALFYGGKRRNDVVGLTDLCYLDFDNVKEGQRLTDAMTILRGDRNVLMVSRSISGLGLHILIRYKLKDMNLPPGRTTMAPARMQELYGRVYQFFGSIYQQKIGLIPDSNGGHMEHLYIVSHDLELYYNPHAEALTIDLNEQTSENI